MAPEQATGEGVDHRVDIYATGILLYCALLGEYPFDGPHATAIITAHMTRTAPSFESVLPDAQIPAGLEAVVFRCLEKKPERRYPSMEALIADLTPFQVDGPLEGVTGEYHTLTAHPAVKRWDWTVMGTGMVVGGVLAVLLALIGVAALIVMKLTPADVRTDMPQPVPPTQAVPAEAPAPPVAAPAPTPETQPEGAIKVRKSAPSRRKPRAQTPVKKKPKAEVAPKPKPTPKPRKRRSSDLRDPWDE